MSGGVGANLFSNLMRRPWVSPGPTIDRLIASMLAERATPTSRGVRVLTGPLGGGKSTGAMGATFVNAAKQPVWGDGIRRYRLTLLRDTYLNAWSQTVPFLEDWWPKMTNGASTPGVFWEGSKGSALDLRLELEFPRPVGPVDYMLQLRALGEHRTEEAIENFFRGLPTTDIWLEEGDTLPRAVYEKAITRLGRYPARGIDGIGARSPTLYLVSNQFLIGSWPYEMKMANRWKSGVELFEQPGGRSPDAENLHNLSAGYYEGIIKESDERTIRRQIDNEHVLPNAGKPVYPEYRDLVHTKPVTLDPNLPLRMGMDGGLMTLNPAATISQMGQGRCLRVKDEVVVGHNAGVDQFAEAINKVLGQPEFARWNGDRFAIKARVDPTAVYGAAPGQLNWVLAMRKKTGIDIKPARTNDPVTRRSALRDHLTRITDGHPAMQVDPKAKFLRMALGGLFHWPKIRAGMATRDADVPAKNHPHSDVAEACEYDAMDNEAVGIIEGKKQGGAKKARKQEFADTD